MFNLRQPNRVAPDGTAQQGGMVVRQRSAPIVRNVQQQQGQPAAPARGDIVIPNQTNQGSVPTQGGVVKAKVPITPDEWKRMLTEYIPVKRTDWANIPYRSHVRYEKNDGTYVRGGFVKTSWEKNGTYHIMLENDRVNRRGPNYVSWTISSANVRMVYKKHDRSIAIEADSMTSRIDVLAAKVNDIINVVNAIEVRLRKLESR